MYHNMFLYNNTVRTDRCLYITPVCVYRLLCLGAHAQAKYTVVCTVVCLCMCACVCLDRYRINELPSKSF